MADSKHLSGCPSFHNSRRVKSWAPILRVRRFNPDGGGTVRRSLINSRREDKELRYSEVVSLPKEEVSLVHRLNSGSFLNSTQLEEDYVGVRDIPK